MAFLVATTSLPAVSPERRRLNDDRWNAARSFQNQIVALPFQKLGRGGSNCQAQFQLALSLIINNQFMDFSTFWEIFFSDGSPKIYINHHRLPHSTRLHLGFSTCNKLFLSILCGVSTPMLCGVPTPMLCSVPTQMMCIIPAQIIPPNIKVCAVQCP